MDQTTSRELWAELQSPIHAVLDPETGEQMAGAVIRMMGSRPAEGWLYADDVDGYQLLSDEDRQRLTLDAPA